jgi:hypothetical protein
MHHRCLPAWPYAHDKFEDEIFMEGAQDWEEVLQRKYNPNMTRFKAMTMDEQVETIEQMAQEALRVREENRAVEATEAQRRGMLLLEEAQRVIQRLENDPQLLEPIRVTPTDTINIRRGAKWLRFNPTGGDRSSRKPRHYVTTGKVVDRLLQRSWGKQEHQVGQM